MLTKDQRSCEILCAESTKRCTLQDTKAKYINHWWIWLFLLEIGGDHLTSLGQRYSAQTIAHLFTLLRPVFNRYSHITEEVNIKNLLYLRGTFCRFSCSVSIICSIWCASTRIVIWYKFVGKKVPVKNNSVSIEPPRKHAMFYIRIESLPPISDLYLAVNWTLYMSICIVYFKWI